MNGSIPCNPQRGVQFGRLAEQSPIAGHEPNDPVEESSTEVRTMLLPSRRASIGSTYNSGVDIATVPASSEVDERPNLGMLASLLLTQQRQAGAAPSRTCHTNRENSVSSSSHFQTSTGRPVAKYPHKRESSRDSNVLQGSYSEREKIFT